MKIKYRLAFSFLAVISLGAALTFALVHRTTESMFRTFVFSGDAEKARVYATMLSDFYQTRGSWDGVQPFLAELPSLASDMIAARLHGTGGSFIGSSYPASAYRTLLADRVVVADADGVIVADTANEIIGTVHPAGHTSHGIPVVVSARKEGTVLVGSMIDSSLTGIAERYLQSITLALFASTALAVILALILGIALTMGITRSLASLAVAAKEVASGNTGISVPVRGRDEISDLAHSFNEMTAELRRLDAAKKQVIADAAHELRTPVTLIRGMIEGMLDGVFPRDDATLSSVHEETIRLARLIETLREIEIIESGKLTLETERVNLGETLRKAVALFSASASEKSIELSFEGSDRAHRNGGTEAVIGDPVIEADPVRFGEVVYNILSNAISYTPRGGIVRLRIERGEKSMARFSVDDSGPGIPAAEREKIFERFYRIEKSRASTLGGRGLGLAIAGEIVKAHGGSIRVGESDLGGASFVVSIPLCATR